MQFSMLENVWLANEALHANHLLEAIGRPTMPELADVAARRQPHIDALHAQLLPIALGAVTLPVATIKASLEIAIAESFFPDTEAEICRRSVRRALDAHQYRTSQPQVTSERPPSMETSTEPNKAQEPPVNYRTIVSKDAPGMSKREAYLSEGARSLRDKALAGDTTALSILLEQHRAYIRRQAENVYTAQPGNVLTLEDLEQEAALLFIELLPECTSGETTIVKQIGRKLSAALLKSAQKEAKLPHHDTIPTGQLGGTLNKTPEDIYIARSITAILRTACSSRLTKRQAFVIEHYYGLGDNGAHTFSRIAEKLSITSNRAQQIRQRALTVLAQSDALKAWGPTGS